MSDLRSSGRCVATGVVASKVSHSIAGDPVLEMIIIAAVTLVLGLLNVKCCVIAGNFVWALHAFGMMALALHAFSPDLPL